MFELLTSATLAALETAINRVIALDPATGPRLKALAGSRVVVESTLPPFALSLLVHEQGLMLGTLATGSAETADTRVSGPAPALLELLVSKSGNFSLYGKDVTVRGDLEKLQRLQRLLHDLRIDWEYYLSGIIGDVPTQGFSDLLHKGLDTLRKGSGSLRMDLDEYLHEESRALPGRGEMEAFYSRLHKLRLDLDRLAARIDLAASRIVDPTLDPGTPAGGKP